MALDTNPALSFRSSDRELELGFDRIKTQALSYVFEGDPVGPWYEAALPGRAAFCMRDVSHQCFGAEMLGLHRQNLNMFRKFAEGMSPLRDWCTYWEIDRYDRPCPVDYANDGDFWYNLPANFDLLDAMYRMYHVSGDAAYLLDRKMMAFRANTMEAYVNRWDRDGDGIPDRVVAEGRRGLVSYDESRAAGKELLYGSDLVAVMIRAYESEAELSRLTGFMEQSSIYRARANRLQRVLNEDLYDPIKGYAAGTGMNGEAVYYDDLFGWSLLYWGVVPEERRAVLLDLMEQQMDRVQIEVFSHFPEVFYRYGRGEAGIRALRRAIDPQLPRKEYPEASFCAVGAVVSGLMGISFNAPKREVMTRPSLAGIEWAELRHVPFPGGELHVVHTTETSSLGNATDDPVYWSLKGTTHVVAARSTLTLGRDR